MLRVVVRMLLVPLMNETYVGLRVVLEYESIINKPFAFWDIGNKCRVKTMLD